MNNAIEVFYYIFGKVYTFLFDTMEITQGVTVGWVLLTIIIFSIIIRSVLALPSISRRDHEGN